MAQINPQPDDEYLALLATDEYHPNTPDMVTYGHELGPFSRKMADQVAAALNSAYSLGLKHGTS
jgi:hypothetical protein